MDFVWSSSVSTNLLAITCQVYTLLFRLFTPTLTLRVSTKGKFENLCGQRNEGGINLMNTEGERKKKVHHLRLGEKEKCLVAIFL